MPVGVLVTRVCEFAVPMMFTVRGMPEVVNVAVQVRAASMVTVICVLVLVEQPDQAENTLF